jgi:hypothetical protein
MKFKSCLFLLFLSTILRVDAQNGITDTLKIGEILKIYRNNPTVFYDVLVMEDGSRIEFENSVTSFKLTVNKLIVNGTAFILASGHGANGTSANNSRARDGDNGGGGLDGKNGKQGNTGASPTVIPNIILELGFEQINQLVIFSQGGNGGPGQNGEDGGFGYHASCDHRAGHGGDGGKGGRGGKGGNSANLILEYTEKTPTSILYFDKYNDGSDWNMRTLRDEMFKLDDQFKSLKLNYYLLHDTLFAMYDFRTESMDSLSRVDKIYFDCFINHQIKFDESDSIFKKYGLFDRFLITDVLAKWHEEYIKRGGIKIYSTNGIAKVDFPAFTRNEYQFTNGEFRYLSVPPKEFLKQEERKGVFIYYSGGQGGFGGYGGNGGRGGADCTCSFWIGSKHIDGGGYGATGEKGENGAIGLTIKPIVRKRN